MKSILVSACLLGFSCKYDGTDNLASNVLALKDEGYELIPFCPEIYGGLSTPREPAECQKDGSVIDKSGEDVSSAYEKGASEAVRMAKLFGCRQAVLKERSPACGFGQIYDGSFRHRLTHGMGKAAQKLMENGVTVFGESETDKLGRF